MNVSGDTRHEGLTVIRRRTGPLIGGQQIIELNWSALCHGLRANARVNRQKCLAFVAGVGAKVRLVTDANAFDLLIVLSVCMLRDRLRYG